MKPFTPLKLTEPNKLQNIFKQLPPDNALKELVNTLALKSYQDLSAVDIEQINNKYKIDILQKHKAEIQGIFEEFATYHLQQELPNDGSQFFHKLSQIIGIDQGSFATILEKVGSSIYKKRYQQAVVNRRLSEDQELELEKLREDLGLAENIAEGISVEVRKEAVNSYLEEIVYDGEVSPEEYEELQNASKSLSINLVLGNDSQLRFNKMLQLWNINHGELIPQQPNILLPKNEICYFIQSVDWYEYRKIRSDVSYGGVTGRIKIAKGIYFRAGNLKLHGTSDDKLIKIDSGTVYITNKRLLFVGGLKNASVQYSHIIDIQPYVDGIAIIKDSGKNPFLSMNEDIEIITALLIRLLTHK